MVGKWVIEHSVAAQIRLRLRSGSGSGSGSGSDQAQIRLRSGSGSDQAQAQIRLRLRPGIIGFHYDVYGSHSRGLAWPLRSLPEILKISQTFMLHLNKSEQTFMLQPNKSDSNFHVTAEQILKCYSRTNTDITSYKP